MTEHKLISGNGFSIDHREAKCDNCGWEGCLCNTTQVVEHLDVPKEYDHNGKANVCPKCGSHAVTIGQLIEPGF